MAQTVFNRVEKKYKLSEEKYRQFLERLLYYMEIDQFGKHTINNIYYDTQDDLLIRRSIEKPKKALHKAQCLFLFYFNLPDCTRSSNVLLTGVRPCSQ